MTTNIPDNNIQKLWTHCVNGLPLSIGSNIQDLYNPSTGTSSIYVASNPVGAQIFIDGIEQTGFRTPAMITDIPSGNHYIKLMSPGFIDIENSIPLESGRTYNVFLSMVKSMQGESSDSSLILVLFAIGLGLLLFRKK
jgi:hypothetical protein